MEWILPKDQEGDIFEYILKSRNIVDREKFFNPKTEHLHDPFLLHDIQKAVQAISEAILKGKKIFIHGDFDVDGVTATAILWQYLYRELKADVTPYIPNRFNEGYGLTAESITKLISMGAELIITVDCGVKDIELVHKYKDKVDFIITDHHTIRSSNLQNSNSKINVGKVVEEFLISADALAVVHPKLSGYPFSEICGAMVSWKLVSALNIFLKKKKDIYSYLDLAAIGTVCDIMPLIDENRAVVKLGIEKLRQTENVGLRALVDVCGVDIKNVGTYEIGFLLGPRLNAAGRLENAMTALKLLCTESEKNAFELANRLTQINLQRQKLTEEYLSLAEEQITKNGVQPINFIYGEEWPEGIVGLIAGRLTEKYNRPTLVGSKNGNVIKGSARSIGQIDITHILNDSSKYLLRFGGHSAAAGFSLQYEFMHDFIKEITYYVSSRFGDLNFTKQLSIDAVINYEFYNHEFATKLFSLNPFGLHNEKPVLAFLNLRLIGKKIIGKDQNHIKLTFKNSENKFVNAIGFGKKDKFESTINSLGSTTLLDIAGSLHLNEWNNETYLDFHVTDLRKSPL